MFLSGKSVTFFTAESDAESARDLVTLLGRSNQPVPAALAALLASQGEGEAEAEAAAKRAAKKEARKKSKEGRPGDWQCSECGARVFAKHDACFRCKTPKPAHARGGGGHPYFF